MNASNQSIRYVFSQSKNCNTEYPVALNGKSIQQSGTKWHHRQGAVSFSGGCTTLQIVLC